MTTVLEASGAAGLLLAEFERSPLFGLCESKSLQQLASSAKLIKRSRREIVAPQGAPFPYLGLVCDGILGVTLNANGPLRRVSQIRLYEAEAGQTFAEVGIFDATPLGEISVISKRATYALLPAAIVLDVARSDPSFFQRFAALAATRARQLAQRMTLQQGWSVASRVAGVLLQFASEKSGMQPAREQLAHFRQRDIAAAAGCVKEAAARAIAELESNGALRREHGHIRYLDRDELIKFSSQ